MSMSDDVSGAVVGISSNVAQKGVEVTTHVTDKVIDAIAKLIQAASNKNLGRGASKTAPEVTSSDMTDIDAGKVGIKELLANARKTGDSVITTDGYSKSDMANITKKAEEYGIPVAFTNEKDKDNIAAHVRQSDKAIFEQICTENMRDKIATRPQELDNFKVEKWEIEGIHRELGKHDLNANWGKTKNGDYFCLFEKADKKAVLMAKSEFMRKCGEVKTDLTITKGEEYGMFTLKDEKSGKEISFSDIPSRNELAEMLQDEFGYDENKAIIACGKFGETQLDGDNKRKFFGDNPRNEFTDIQTHVELKGESILVKDYDCLRVTPKIDGVPCIVFKDENNNFAVLRPEKMTREQMSAVIRESLNIEDEKTITALAVKADKLGDYYGKQNAKNFTVTRNAVIGDVQDDKSIEFTSDIERLDKNKFKVDTSAQVREYKGLNVDDVPKGDDDNKILKTSLVLSFSNKKSALAELQAMYESQGVPADVAKQSAKEVFKKAQAQSAEKIMQIEEIKNVKQSAEVHGVAANEATASVMTVKYGNRTEDIEMGEREATLSEIREKFGVDEKEAETLLDKAQEKNNDVHETNPEKPKTKEKPADTPLNGHERTPTESVNVGTQATAPQSPKVDVPTGGKRR